MLMKCEVNESESLKHVQYCCGQILQALSESECVALHVTHNRLNDSAGSIHESSLMEYAIERKDAAPVAFSVSFAMSQAMRKSFNSPSCTAMERIAQTKNILGVNAMMANFQEAWAFTHTLASSLNVQRVAFSNETQACEVDEPSLH